MKKIYILTLSLMVSLAHYGQFTIATIDRENGTGPTLAASVANITAIGMTRSGVTQNGSSGSGNFTSRNWETVNTINRAVYIEWSIKANSNYIMSLTELGIRYRRSNNQAPRELQIYYSLDDFDATGPNPEGFPIGAQQSYSNNESTQNTLLFPLTDVESDTGGAITFRLYGWNAPNRNGELIIEPNTAWTGSLGIANPGIRLQGSVYKELIYSGGIWTPNAPSATSGSDRAIVLDGNYIPTTDISLKSLTVRPAGNVTIPSGITLNCPSNNYESSSTHYSSLLLNGTINGTVNYSRHVNSGAVAGIGGNDLIAAPLSGQTFGAFAAVNSNIITDPNNANRKLFGPFNKSTGTFQIYDTSINGAVALSPGIGYRAASTDNGNFIFTGTVNTTTVSQPLANSGPQFAPWNLIGNPYPSYLYVTEQKGTGAHPGFLNINSDQLDPNNVAIYGYDNNSSDGDIYTIWNLANTNSSTVMTPGQGFFVVSKVGGGSVDFTPGMRSIGSTDDFILGRQANETNNASLKLKLSNATKNYVTDFYFNDASTLGLDPGYDAGLFGGSAPVFSIFSQLVENNSGVNMAIQSLPYSRLGSEVIIPVGMRLTQGQQVTISIANSTIPDNVEVYLEDTAANTSTLLSNSDYVFNTSSNLSGAGRFYLRFTSSTLSTPKANLSGLDIFTTTTPRALFIKGVLSTPTNLTIYDMQGRLVMTSPLDISSNSNQIDVSSLSSGLYMVNVNNSVKQKTQKIILK